MAAAGLYYDVLASLPPLPYFERAERVPINRQRLDECFTMLEAGDAELAERIGNFLSWHRQPPERTDAEMVRMYDEFSDIEGQPTLKELIKYRMNVRTILAALRRRLRGLPPPAHGEAWGVGDWVWMIERNWNDPDFKLASANPWIPDAREFLNTGKTLELERVLMAREWNWLDSLLLENEFSFSALGVYAFKWDILYRWLSNNPKAAAERFEEMVLEVTGEHYQLFNGRT